MKKGSDRRVQRTHRLLTEALVELILERGFDAVTVQALCERADVGRATFYTHFADKEELLVGGLDSLRSFLREQAPLAPGSRPLAFARGVIEHAHEQRRLFRAVVGNRSGHVVHQTFRRLVLRLVREDLEHWAPGHPRLDPAIHSIGGALLELLTWWVDARSPLEPSALEAEFHLLSDPVLASLGKAARRGG